MKINKTISLAFVLVLLSMPMVGKQLIITVSASTTHDVYPGQSIQEAINSAQLGDTVFVHSGIYYENVVVNRTVSLIGENRSTTIIDGNKAGIVILANADSVVIREFTVKNGNTGIYFDRSNDSLAMENNVMHNVDAIFANLSDNCTIYRNLVGNNTQRGILITNSRNFTVNNNHVYGNGWYGINANASMNGLIVQNNVYENYFDGIGVLNSSNCIIAGNNVKDNVFFGIWVDSSDDNLIYHNNLINNGFQATTTLSTNRWDNGVEGNYWSNYTGVDADRDGIGDTSHSIDKNNQDNNPLMGMFSSFNTSLDYDVNVVSNSSIEDFEYFESNSTIRMQVSNMTANQTFGFCRVCIPHALMSEPYNVTIDGANPVFWNYTLYDNGTHRWIYFVYQHSTHGVIIQGLDTAPPIISILSPENKTYPLSEVPLTFTVDEPADWIGYSLDGQANVTITGNTTLSGLSDGSHSLTVYAKDTAGNTGASEISCFTIETEKEEPFPTWIVASIVIAGIAVLAVAVYFLKKRKPPTPTAPTLPTESTPCMHACL